MKAFIKHLFPTPYQFLYDLKEAIKERLYPEKRFWHYYTAERDYQRVPEMFLEQVKLPGYVRTVIDYGCASGRNFIPFNGKYNLWGLDIIPEEKIKWIRNFQNLKYEQMTFYDFTRFLEQSKIDLSEAVIMTSAVLMYIPCRWQIRFYNASKARGCRNFIFIENPPGTRSFGRTIKMPLDDFTPMFNGEKRSVAYTILS